MSARRMIHTGIILILLGILSACMHNSPNLPPVGRDTETQARPEEIRKGDLVRLNVIARLSDGALIFTTDPLAANKDGVSKAKGYIEPDCFEPVTVLAGEEGPVPGIADILAGMHAGESRTVTLAPEKAYGIPDKKKIMQLDCVKIVSRTTTMKPDEYMTRFKAFPVIGAKLDLNPYFPSKVTKVTESQAEVVSLAKDGMNKDGPFGRTEIRVKGDEIRITLIPLIGSDFELFGKKGTIVSTDGKTFSVDLNNPLAGKDVVVGVEVLSVTSGRALDAVQIPWTDDYQAGLARAKSENKPVVLVLYASWCQWSKKYFSETLMDPKIKAMKDSFVWIKIDSDKNKKYYEQYQQNKFPFTILINPDGTVMDKTGGFTDASEIIRKLTCVSRGEAVKKAIGTHDVQPQKQEQGCTGQ